MGANNKYKQFLGRYSTIRLICYVGPWNQGNFQIHSNFTVSNVFHVSPKLTYLGASTKPYHKHILNIYYYHPTHISIVYASFFFVLEGDPVKAYHYVSPKLTCLWANTNYKFCISRFNNQTLYPVIIFCYRTQQSLIYSNWFSPDTQVYVSLNIVILRDYVSNWFGSLQSIIY